MIRQLKNALARKIVLGVFMVFSWLITHGIAQETSAVIDAQQSIFGEVSPAQREFVVVSGGPAVRFYERDKRNSHDKYWGNFVDSAVLYMRQLRTELQDGDQVTWLVYRPGYVERGVESQQDLLSTIRQAAGTVGAQLLWFDNTDQLINHLNRGFDRSQVKIYAFHYFGHSNKACFLFDYSNEVDGLSIVSLHARELRRIDSEAFARDADCKSWGCHSGEYYSTKWRQNLGVPMEGAVGKTDYSRGGWPFLSSKNGRWTTGDVK